MYIQGVRKCMMYNKVDYRDNAPFPNLQKVQY